MKKVTLLIILICLCLEGIHFLKNKGVNNHPENNIKKCIDLDKETLNVRSFGKDFTVNYVKNSPRHDLCISPNFPAIEIDSPKKANAWIQIVRSDTESQEYKIFIDRSDLSSVFYSRGKTFYDAPYWFSSFFHKPLSIWKAHAYAVYVDERKNVISPLGGGSWGVTLRTFSFSPTAIIPFSLTKRDWKEDKKILEKEVRKYNFVSIN